MTLVGGQATNLEDLDWHPLKVADSEATHGLEDHGGGGTVWETQSEYWAWPLRDGGDVQLVVEWPAYGIPETAVTLDGAAIAAAARRAQPLFPDQADRPSHMNRAAAARAYRARSGQDE